MINTVWVARKKKLAKAYSSWPKEYIEQWLATKSDIFKINYCRYIGTEMVFINHYYSRDILSWTSMTDEYGRIQEEEEEYPCLSATLQYRVLSEDSFEKPDISSYNYF